MQSAEKVQKTIFGTIAEPKPLNSKELDQQTAKENQDYEFKVFEDLQKAISDDFTERSAENSKLRRGIAKWLLGVFIGEVTVGIGFLVAFGREWLHFPAWSATAFFVAGLGHSTYLLQKIVGYLFSDRPTNPLMEKITQVHVSHRENLRTDHEESDQK